MRMDGYFFLASPNDWYRLAPQKKFLQGFKIVNLFKGVRGFTFLIHFLWKRGLHLKEVETI